MLKNTIYLAEEYGKEYVRNKQSKVVSGGIFQSFCDLKNQCTKEEIQQINLAFEKGRKIAENE